MTENEAIEWLEYFGNTSFPYDRTENKRKIACKMAIQALEEIQAYHAIGTVEECQKTANELAEIKNAVENFDQYGATWEKLDSFIEELKDITNFTAIEERDM